MIILLFLRPTHTMLLERMIDTVYNIINLPSTGVSSLFVFGERVDYKTGEEV